MIALPPDLEPYRRTPEFTHDSVPAGLRRSHRTKPGTWGEIVVLEGSVTYRILEPAPCAVRLDTHRSGVIRPEVAHEVEPAPDTRFYVQFYREVAGR